MTEQASAPLHPAARRDLARALQLLAMAARRAPPQATPILTGAAVSEAISGSHMALAVEVLVRAPGDLLPALHAQGWREIPDTLGFRLSHPATSLALVIDAPASASFATPDTALDAGAGHALRYSAGP
jgi:hypothetical protein